MDIVTDSPATWTQLITDNFITLTISDVTDAFEGSLRSCDLGETVRLTIVQSQGCRVHRDTRGVRADASNDLLLLTPLEGQVIVRQEGSECTIGPGVVSVHVADRPYDLRFQQPGRVLVMQAPRRIVPSSELVSRERRCTGVDGAIVRVFRAFATEAIAAANQLTSSERDELGVTASDLAVGVLGATRPGFAESSAGSDYLFLSARSFIRSRLGDPELTPAVVAGSQGVSLRSLQTAFGNAGSSPAAFIRSERLRQSQRLLDDRRRTARSVAQIAHEVGYADPNVFIRAFKREFGRTPAAWRSERGPRV